MLGASPASATGIESLYAVYVVSSWGMLALTAVAGVSFVLWLRRACSRARSAVPDAPCRPGWAVVAWLVPLVWWWKPYQLVRDLWRVSHHGSSWRSQPPPVEVTHWWTLWLAAGLAYWLAWRAVAQPQLSASASAVCLTCLLLAGLRLRRLVRDVTDAQRRWLGSD
jgi:hypothetical protein